MLDEMFQQNASKFATLEKAMSVVVSLMKKKTAKNQLFISTFQRKIVTMYHGEELLGCYRL